MSFFDLYLFNLLCDLADLFGFLADLFERYAS